MKWLLGFAFVLEMALSAGFTAQASPNAYYLNAHSHNDYEQSHPLYNALNQKVYSFEADIWLSSNAIKVSHTGWSFRGTLEDLYLAPLQKLVNQKGSVYGDGKTVYLWLDIKDGNAELRKKLQQLLNRYPMLSEFSDTEFIQRPVTVILTGDEESKTRFVSENPIRRACRDSNRFSAQDPEADFRWNWYAIKWSDYIRWSGNSAMPLMDRLRLSSLVAKAHALGRKIRFWDVPDIESVWQAIIEAGADLVSSDNLPRLHKFLNFFGSKPAYAGTQEVLSFGPITSQRSPSSSHSTD